jgi:hypothetical protein
MKNLPGLKIVGFSTLVLMVALGVYAATQEKSEHPSRQPNVLVKLGWEGSTPDLSEPLEKLKYETALKFIRKWVRGDPNLYVVKHYENGSVTCQEGNLKTCADPKPSPSSSSPAPSPYSPTAAPSPEASASGTPKGSRTQTIAAVALTFGNSEEFLKTLNRQMQAEERGGTAGKEPPKKK